MASISNPIDDELQSLMHAVGAGSMPAMAALYARTSTRVYALALRMLREPACAEEIVAEVYLQAWRAARSYDPARGGVDLWLLMMCRSRALDAIRAREAEPREAQEGAGEIGDDPFDLVASMQRGAAIRTCLASLPAQSRQLVALAFFRDYTHAQIASWCGLPLGTVKSQIRRALATMKRQLAAIAEDVDD